MARSASGLRSGGSLPARQLIWPVQENDWGQRAARGCHRGKQRWRVVDGERLKLFWFKQNRDDRALCDALCNAVLYNNGGVIV